MGFNAFPSHNTIGRTWYAYRKSTKYQDSKLLEDQINTEGSIESGQVLI
jgi:hypothetical protein